MTNKRACKLNITPCTAVHGFNAPSAIRAKLSAWLRHGLDVMMPVLKPGSFSHHACLTWNGEEQDDAVKVIKSSEMSIRILTTAETQRPQAVT